MPFFHQSFSICHCLILSHHNSSLPLASRVLFDTLFLSHHPSPTVSYHQPLSLTTLYPNTPPPTLPVFHQNSLQTYPNTFNLFCLPSSLSFYVFGKYSFCISITILLLSAHPHVCYTHLPSPHVYQCLLLTPLFLLLMHLFRFLSPTTIVLPRVSLAFASGYRTLLKVMRMCQ